MELNEFAGNFPELFEMFNEDVNSVIGERKITGNESLRDWDNMIDGVVKKYEQNDYYGYNIEDIPAQQIMPYDGYRSWDGRYGRYRRDRRRRFRDFDVRDIFRILFLRQLFDGNRRYWY